MAGVKMVNNISTLVVISYYDKRPLENLENLLNSMREYDAGAEYSVCVVVNRTSSDEINLNFDAQQTRILYRENSGMNIGAWDYGWRANPEFNEYLFLQDECYIVRNNWLIAFQRLMLDSAIGLVGESLNKNWDDSWSVLRDKQKDVELPGHEIDGLPANRVDVYLRFFSENDIKSGDTGLHVRSLVWCMRKNVLEKIGGFPIGKNFGECIASEIGVSKKIEASGLLIQQIDENPFHYIRHHEWIRVGSDSVKANNKKEGGLDFWYPVISMKKFIARMLRWLSARCKN